MNDREIKFRVYSFLDKAWHYFDIYDGVPIGIAGGLSEPCQFIGIFDKNTKPIFEGDIVKVLVFRGTSKQNLSNDIKQFDFLKEEYFTGVVEFDNGCFVIKTETTFGTSIDCGCLNQKEVIGNIIENKHTLKLN